MVLQSVDADSDADVDVSGLFLPSVSHFSTATSLSQTVLTPV